MGDDDNILLLALQILGPQGQDEVHDRTVDATNDDVVLQLLEHVLLSNFHLGLWLRMEIVVLFEVCLDVFLLDLVVPIHISLLAEQLGTLHLVLKSRSLLLLEAEIFLFINLVVTFNERNLLFSIFILARGRVLDLCLGFLRIVIFRRRGRRLVIRGLKRLCILDVLYLCSGASKEPFVLFVWHL